MIAHVKGIVVEKFNSSVIVDVQGVGYEVTVPAGEYDKLMLDDAVKLYTYHHIREQTQELFGFSSLTAKKIFEMLITVQGVGPKAAISILSVGDTESVRNAIGSSDVAFISKAVGVGKKTAERVALDLHDKVGPVTGFAKPTETEEVKPAHIDDDALQALMALGFSLQDASERLAHVPADLTTSERVTAALKG